MLARLLPFLPARHPYAGAGASRLRQLEEKPACPIRLQPKNSQEVVYEQECRCPEGWGNWKLADAPLGSSAHYGQT